ncbi:MAG: APC family permease [Chloroflexi bacterium]|nr:APC family permease [Chloroflexota bacterium]
MASSEGGVQLFTRRASGMTRTVSPWAALAFAFVGPGMHYAFLYYTQEQTLYPGANGFWASFLILAIFPIAGIYVYMSLSMPRSGGEYIYVSRILHPVLGFVASWTLTIVGLQWSGLITQWAINWGLGNAFLAEGMVTKNQTLIDWGKYLSVSTEQSRWAIWIIGFVMIALMFWLISMGPKRVMRVMWISMSLMWVMLITFIIVALTAGPDKTVAGMEAVQGIKYADIIAQVNQLSGGAGVPSYTVIATIWAGLAFVNLCVLGSTYAANISGEIKKVNVAQPLAQIGSLTMFLVWWIVFTAVANAGIGENLIRNFAYLETTGGGTALLGTYPTISYMVAWATDNWFLILLAGPGIFFIATWSSAVALSFAPIRNIFAWSFDGIFPAFMSKVNRTGSPTYAVIFGFIVSAGIFTISTFTTWYAYVTYTVTIWFVGWVILGIAALVFPYVRRDIFEKSPQAVQAKIAGIPVISILGFVCFVVSIITIYSTFLVGTTPTMNVANLVWTAVFFVAAPFVIYFVAYFIQRSRGVPMDMRFKTIPPD